MSAIFKKAKKRSPIKSKIGRDAGQSLSEKRIDLMVDRALWPLSLAGMFALTAWMEIVHAWLKTPPVPWLFVGLFLLVVLVYLPRFVRAIREVRNLKLGEQGERAVGGMLEKLRAEGYEVVHDIQDGAGNIDHVLIGPGGVFAIETKTISKGGGKDENVVFDGKRIKVNGIEPDRDPVVQAKACAQSVRRRITEKLGLDVGVRPVVIYPGWWVNSPKDSDVLVLNDNYFEKSVSSFPRVLSQRDLAQIVAVIRDWGGEQ